VGRTHPARGRLPILPMCTTYCAHRMPTFRLCTARRQDVFLTVCTA
jgi:hypothetical protein